MQHDLFHVYTVDAHLLFVVRNLRRMDVPKHDDELPECSRLMQGLFKKHRLYLAALFHDIGKGRGGDHSILGERDALRFCRAHDLSDYDATFVAWLVRTHLLMSWVAQRQDISDPEVINQFAAQVGDQERLDNLYLLTVADMRGTSPKVWNDWKGKLLNDLYHDTSRALRRGKGQPIQAEDKIRDVQQETLQLLGDDRAEVVSRLWAQFDQDYFLRNVPESLAWHALLLLEKSAADFPLVDLRLDASSGTARFLVCCPDSEDLLCRVTAGLDRLTMNIVDARVHRLSTNLVIMVFVVLAAKHEGTRQFELDGVVDRLRSHLLSRDWELPARRPRVQRALKHFPIETTVRFSDPEAQEGVTVMELVAQDRPGLLLQVAKALLSCKIHLVNAKVGTFGARAEDIFYITDRDGMPLVDPGQRACVEEQICTALP
jgi:[protein-PII] uridylyltransferase